ncbi:unnamed protein product [Alternaria alternata]
MTNSHPDDDPLVPRDVSPADSYLLRTSQRGDHVFEPALTSFHSSCSNSTAPSLEAVIGGVGYQLPSSDQDAIDVMLQDGSIAQLLANKIIIGTLSDGITAKPGEATEPEEGDDDDDNGGGGGGGLFGALGGIAKGATSAIGGAIDGVGSVTTGALGFAGGTVGAAAGLSEPLSGAVGNMGKFVSSLNGIQKSFPGNELTKGALDTFTGAQSLARQSLNWMKSTANLAQDFPNLPADVQVEAQVNGSGLH